MSWTQSNKPFSAFKQAADNDKCINSPTQLFIKVWEKSSEYPDGYWHPRTTDLDGLNKACELRIIFAPLDLPRRVTRDAFINLFQILGVPDAFTVERVQSTSHSFGTTTDSEGLKAWFHFLCKLVRISSQATEVGRTSQVHYHPEADPTLSDRPRGGQSRSTSSTELRPLPQADYSYLRSGFFLRRNLERNTTLVCFGPTLEVESRIKRFIDSKAWIDLVHEPYILFDLILDGLFLEIDQNVWNMNMLFGDLEHQTLQIANSKTRTTIPKTLFVELHNLSKHIIHLNEAIQSSLLLTDSILKRVGMLEPYSRSILSGTRSSSSGTTIPTNDVHQQLRDSLEYRKSLFQSTELRLGSLQKRIQNSIALSFNLVTQQDSLVMIQDSSSMKVIAAITMLFLPTTAVTGVVGSQLFLTSYADTDGTWTILRTPLFTLLWYFTVPLTIVVVALAWAWQKYGHLEHAENRFQLLKRLTFYPVARSTSSTV